MEVSVIITCYNYARYLGRAIRSVYNQSLEKNKYEIIVINDASTDETPQILHDYEDLIRGINLPQNVGLAEARNIGVRKSMGQFVVFIDADDYIHRDMLLMQYNYLTLNPALDSVSVNYVTVSEEEQHLESYSAAEDPIACGIMYRKDLFFDIGLYDKTFKAREEEDFRIRFLKKYSTYNIPLPLYRYRRHGANLTSNAEVMNHFAEVLRTKHT
ncbi:MAG: glycosyltransferase family A protein [Bacteroidia bacterium]|jgi:glycosyltransferase involved in cell wall biosynthesis|nr:glycosyltransferase family A protein [Bacteroidia bacterium]